MKVGFIGQGVVGRAVADELEQRTACNPVRYSLEEEFVRNRDEIRECDVVYVCVPTPTTKDGFDSSIVFDSLGLLRDGAIALIKSTTLPGTVNDLQYAYDNISIISQPEFLNARTAKSDADHPIMNVVGLSYACRPGVAAEIEPLLPETAFTLVTDAATAELIKYMHNVHGVFRVVYANLLFDLTRRLRASWPDLVQAMNKDPYLTHMTTHYNSPIHASSNGSIGRGAGGNCFIKDTAAFRELVGREAPSFSEFVEALEKVNRGLLRETGKDLDILRGVYE